MKIFCIPASLFACKSGVVDQLDFSQLRLEQFPKEIIKSRKHIAELLLNVNSIEELPSELFRCTKIRRLDVSENKIKVIPTEIGALQLLEELNISKNEIVEIPEEIEFCQNLAILDISTNIVTGFPRSFVNLSQLASLNLSNNSLTQLPPDIDRLINLQFLDVAQCELRSLPASIVRLERLRVLDLCDNYLTELPAKMNGMISLEILDLHCNMIGRLPDEFLRCQSLRTLDLSGNQLNELPANIGDLQNLMELVLCENHIQKLPNTIGQLKKLEVLKASKNCLNELTPSICSCSNLTDLFLCENQLNELPASIGNLRRLRFLDVNVNNLQSIPSTIGGCQSLGILTLRHNQLNELPMEIGRLNQLQVLDVADNNLKYLPYTLTVLYQAKTLSALWLSFNQPPLPKLTTTNEPVMNIKVLTCYLLPQKEAQPVKRASSKSCVGGARVCFAGDRQEEEEEDKVPIGRFERYDTPHPKPFAPKNRHNRNSGDFSGTVPPLGPLDSSRNADKETLPQDPSMIEPSRPLRSVLKRRPQSVISQISNSELNALLGAEENGGGGSKGQGRKLVRKNLQIRKSENGFQWKIIGGADSLPYKGKTGLFISHLVESGNAERAGFQVDDQLLACNGQDMRGLSHHEAIDLIQRNGDLLEFLVEREICEREPLRSTSIEPYTNINNNDTAPTAVAAPERLTFLITRSGTGSVGFSVSGTGKWSEDPFIVASITSSLESPLKPGDRIIAVGAINLKFGARLDQVKTLLAGMPGTRVEIIIERGGQWPPPSRRVLPSRYGAGPSVCGSAFTELALSRSLPSLLAPLPGQSNAPNQQHQQMIPAAAETVTVHHQQQPHSLIPSSQPQRLFQRQPSIVRPTTIGPPQPPPRHHRSLSSLVGPIPVEVNGITPEMLRASTPIEYPPGEEPQMLDGNDQHRTHQQHQQQAIKTPSPPPKPTRLPLPASTSFSVESNKSPSAIISPPLPPKMNRQHNSSSNSPEPGKSSPSSSIPIRMDFGGPSIYNRMEPPLATSSPIPQNHQEQIEKPKSFIPVLMSTSINGKIPPPVAPKPKSTSNGNTDQQVANDHATSPSTTSINCTIDHQKPQTVEHPSSIGSSTSFSSKLKLFEQLQTTSGMASRMNGGGENCASEGTQQNAAKPSGIPLKKPLVSAQDMEKLREVEEMRKRLKLEENGGKDEEDADEHRDTVRELTKLLSEQQNGGIISSLGPSVIRTKKAEIRAERAASELDNSWNGSTEDGSDNLSRANSSLSQRAAEIEKRREWRQARLQSMDVESKRTDDLVKLIANATGTTPSNTPSPIPAGP